MFYDTLVFVISLPGATVYAASVVEQAGSSYFLYRIDATGERRLGIGGDLTGFAGQEVGQGVLLCPCSAKHAVALRLVAECDPALFRAMLDHARAHFEHDRKAYFLDAQLSKVPAGEAVSDPDLPDLLNQFDARQVLHVAFGSIHDAYGDPLCTLIAAHEDAFRAGLERHFTRHLSPFVSPVAGN